jgi:FtsH-binding integral membrane protein
MVNYNPYQTSNAMATSYGDGRVLAANASESARTTFIRRTYACMGGAMFAFVALEALLLAIIPTETILTLMLGTSWSWLVVLGLFMGVSWVARSWAESSTSPAMQYAGLGLYVAAQAIIFLPLMSLAIRFDPTIPLAAGLVTLFVFSGLTVMTFMTRADFSWMGRYLWLAGIAALLFVVLSAFGLFAGAGIGIWFAAFMVILASAYILYDTSNIQHHYHTDQHVAAALALFASVALLLWYVIQIFMYSRD